MQVEGVDTYQVINGADLVRRFRHEIEYLDFARMLEKVVQLEQVENTSPSPRAAAAVWRRTP